MKAIRNILLGIFVVAALCYLNVVIPQPQKTDAHVQDYPHTDSCGRSPSSGIQVTMQDDACGGFFKASNDYNTTAHVTNTAPYQIDGIQLHFKTYFCVSDSEITSTGACLQREHDFQSDVFSLAPGASRDFSTPTLHSTDYQSTNACGLFQNDFWFSYNNGACTSTINGTGTGFGFAGVGYCHLWDGHTLKSTNPWNPAWECNRPTPPPTATPTPTPVPTATPTPTPLNHNVCQNFACVQVPGPGVSTCTTSHDCSHLGCLNESCERFPGPGPDTCTTEPNSCATPHHLACVSNSCQSVPGPGSDSCTTNPNSCNPPTLTVIKVVNNNHGGTKTPADFVLRVNGTQVANNVANTETPGDYTVSEDAMDGYHQVSISGSCDSSGHVHLDGGESKTCIIENEDNGSGTCTMPTCNTSISGCSYPFPDTKSCSCGPLVCITNTPSNVTVNVNQSQNQQQQQQQAVLGASVAPASTPSQLPSTGAGADILLTLVGLLPVGFKLRKLV